MIMNFKGKSLNEILGLTPKEIEESIQRCKDFWNIHVRKEHEKILIQRHRFDLIEKGVTWDEEFIEVNIDGKLVLKDNFKPKSYF